MLTTSYTLACQVEINATIYPKEHLLIATIVDDKQQTHTIHKKYPQQIQEHFVSLLDTWHPTTEGLCHYRLHLTLPNSFTAISESETIMIAHGEKDKTYHFSLSKPLKSLNIIASDDFIIQSSLYKDINISTYFFSSHNHLSQSYIEKTKSYIKLYESIIGDYPFKTFNIVENQFQTGYSMPTFTLIGSRIIDKPFLLETSLGHEILHQWFGNSIFNDFEKGNWVEGITTYLADHHYKEEKGTGYLYRKNILHNYNVTVDKNSSFPLGKFIVKTDKASSAIGYGKGTFAFHMLQKSLGEEKFFTILKDFYQTYRFKEVTYTEIKKFFSQKSGKDLQALFHFLFEEESIIDFKVSNIKTLYHDKQYHLAFDISTGLKTENLILPLTIMIDDKVYETKIENNSSLSFTLNSRPHTLTLDPYCDLFRHLSPPEKLSTLSSHFKTFLPKFPNVEILESKEKGFKIWVDAKDGTLHLASSGKKQLKNMQYKLPHYGSYQSLHFVDGKIRKKEKSSSQNGIMIEVSKPDSALAVPQNLTLKEIVEKVKDNNVLFVGEYHDNFAHHLNQKNIIQMLHEKGKKVAIGLEMFQRRFQPVLNDYIAGNIDEKTFLTKSEYFMRWGYDYNFYRPIILYAKENKLPLIALNLEREITKQISKKGLASLSKEDKKKIPQSLDFSDEPYKERLFEVFDNPEHFAKMPPEHRPNPNFLYQSQILWDETMAESTADYLKAHPDTLMIVLVGNGHLEHFVGIPNRVSRRIAVKSTVILQDSQVQAGIADFVLSPQSLQTKTTPKLGVHLAVDKLQVLSIIENSSAEKLGILKDDVILKFADMPVKVLADLKLALYLYHEKKNLTVTVQRGKKEVLLK